MVPLDKPEEILPLLRRTLRAEAWAGAQLWLDGLEPWPDDLAALPWRRLWYRLRHGVAPTPALVLRDPTAGTREVEACGVADRSR